MSVDNIKKSNDNISGNSINNINDDNNNIQSIHVHSSAIIDAGANIGDGTRIWHFSHVCSKAVIGKNCTLGQNVFIANNVIIGNNVKVQNNVSIYDAVYLEDDVFCGPSMVFTNVINPRSHVSRKHEYRKTLVKRGATIGANATILCGATIGEYALIGAGSTVTNNVRAYAIVVGVPARQTGWVCKCGQKLLFEKDVASCSYCRQSYNLVNDECLPV